MKLLILSPAFLIGGYGTLYAYKTWGTVGIAILCGFFLLPAVLFRLFTGKWPEDHEGG